MKLLRYILSVVALLLASYGLITQNFNYTHLMTLFLGLTMLVMGLEEFKKERKSNGWVLILVFLFSLFVSIKGFL